MFMKLLKRLNPERNLKIRAMLYVIGIGGFSHLSILLILSITKGKSELFNPANTIDLEKIFPRIVSNPFTYALGWLIFFGLIFLVYRILVRNQEKTPPHRNVNK